VILPKIEGIVWEWDGWIWLGIALRYRVILSALVPFVTLYAPLWIKLCDHFVPPLCLCDILKFNLMGSFSLQL
jgi:hypothetical protein